MSQLTPGKGSLLAPSPAPQPRQITGSSGTPPLQPGALPTGQVMSPLRLNKATPLSGDRTGGGTHADGIPSSLRHHLWDRQKVGNAGLQEGG